MTGHQAKQALERSTPYVSIGNLIALGALLVMSINTGVIDVTAGDNPASQGQVSELRHNVVSNTSSIAELRRINSRQDQVIEANQARLTGRLQRVAEKVDRIYRLLIGRVEPPHERRGPG